MRPVSVAFAILFVCSGCGGNSSVSLHTQQMQDESPQVRLEAVKSLAEYGCEAIPALVQAVGDDDLQVQLAAVRALRELGPEAKIAIPALVAAQNRIVLRPQGMPKLVGVVVGGDPRAINIRGEFDDALEDIGPPTVASLIESLRLGDREANAAARHMFLYDFDPPPVQQMQDAFFATHNDFVRYEVNMALEELGYKLSSTRGPPPTPVYPYPTTQTSTSPRTKTESEHRR